MACLSCKTGRYRSETIVLPQPDGGLAHYFALICESCGYFHGQRRHTPPSEWEPPHLDPGSDVDPFGETVTFAGPLHEPCEIPPLDDMDDTPPVNVRPSVIGSSEPPPPQAIRPKKPSYAGLYIEVPGKKRT